MQTSNALLRYRKDRKLSQEELAAVLGVTKATISRWEAGKRFPDRDLWPIILEKTGLTPNDMSSLTGEAAQ